MRICASSTATNPIRRCSNCPISRSRRAPISAKPCSTSRRNGEYGPLEDVEAFVDEKVALARQFEPHYFERTRANGTSISVEGSPLDEGGWITVYTDITEIKRQERFIRSHAESLSEELVQRSEDLAQSNRELSATIRALEAAKLELTESRERISLINRMIPAHIAHVDATGRYTHSNGNLGKILPASPVNMVGHTMADALGPEIWPQVEPSFRSAMSGKSTVSEVRDDQTGHFIRLAMSPRSARKRHHRRRIYPVQRCHRRGLRTHRSGPCPPPRTGHAADQRHGP